MPQLLQPLIDFSPVIAIFFVYALLRGDIKSINARIDGINTRLDDLKEHINARFEHINARFDDLKENTNARFDDLKENTNARFDDFREYNRLNQEQFTNLSNKVDNLAAQVSRIESSNLPRTGTEG